MIQLFIETLSDFRFLCKKIHINCLIFPPYDLKPPAGPFPFSGQLRYIRDIHLGPKNEAGLLLQQHMDQDKFSNRLILTYIPINYFITQFSDFIGHINYRYSLLYLINILNYHFIKLKSMVPSTIFKCSELHFCNLQSFLRPVIL